MRVATGHTTHMQAYLNEFLKVYAFECSTACVVLLRVHEVRLKQYCTPKIQLNTLYFSATVEIIASKH